MSLKSNIWKFYLVSALGMHFITPIRILYLLSFGMTYAQIAMMELAASIAIILLEIPSGIFADLLGRKLSRLISYALSISAFTCLSFGSTPVVFIFGWALSGAADAFQSGASDALVYDTLKQLGREGDYLKIKSHFLLITTISVIIGSIIGARLYLIDHRLPWYLVTISIVLSAVVFSTINEPKNIFTSKNLSVQFNGFIHSLKFSLGSIEVKRLLVIGLVLAIPAYVFTTLLDQPYLISRGYDIQSLGYIFAITTGVSGFVASLSYLLASKFSPAVSFSLIFIFMSLFYILLGTVNHPAVFLLIIGLYIADKYKNIVLDNSINQEINSTSRATILSVQSFVNNILISLLFVFIGHFIDLFSLDTVMIYLGIILAIIFVLLIPLIFSAKQVVEMDKQNVTNKKH